MWGMASFAENILFFAQSYPETVSLLNDLVTVLSQVGLIVNANKTWHVLLLDLDKFMLMPSMVFFCLETARSTSGWNLFVTNGHGMSWASRR